MAPPNNRRPGFSKRAQYSIFASYLLGILGAVLGLLLLLISFVDPRGFSALRTAGAEVMAPISKSLSEIGGATGSAGDEIAAYFNAASKNAAMQRELEKNRSEILEARALRQENERLKRLLKLDEEVPDSIAMARLISSTASSSRRIATLGVGSSSGLEPGQPVRSPEGLVGRILETGPTTARVLLVSDGNNVTPVQRARDSLPAFATGRGDGTVDIQPINIGSNPFKTGDLMITSGSGGLYSPGIPVAVVIRKTETGAIGRVLANPAKVSHAIVQPIFQAETMRQIEKNPVADGELETGE
ncbi:MAG: rod shape-determining protein MreC [Sphingomonadales bacterium]|nr:rod shape-determining protein MreC [Sphingomonadales bacterium]PIX67354.1 MAG: rod shape-determining protein MreC [Sphingomonadales bacterium CG_4_10_14_3_um_filter_58_15]NCO48070.1 rod shape-determining protein MreC [Sphingomonadales bacterium]NCO99640.1 rod shape-determining protein MreC [Sphingomonadales bacterium]NCP27203.1 rod shape-determining protein MreC [Sphingomonadales bacterium]